MSYRAASYSGIRTIRWKIEFYSMDLDATQIIRVRVILHRGIRTITTRVRVVHAFTTKVVNPELSFSCLARIDSNKLDHDSVSSSCVCPSVFLSSPREERTGG